MAIFRIVKAARSESSTSSTSSSVSTSSSSSSSSDDSSNPRQHSKLKRIVAKPAHHFELCDKNTEICQVGDTVFRLPQELFQMEDLSCILSIDTWNNSLTEKERDQLCVYLPDMDEKSYQRTMTELLGGVNINFGNPLSTLLRQLKGGLCSPKATKQQDVSRLLQRIEHCHDLRRYHNEMVNSFSEMQCMWSQYPEVDTDERMELWHARNSTSGRPTQRLESSVCGKAPLKETSSSMVTKSRRKSAAEEGKFAELHLEALKRVPTQKGSVGGRVYSENREALKQNNRKRHFLPGKYSSNANPVDENETKFEVKGKKRSDKSNKHGEMNRSMPGVKMRGNKGSGMGTDRHEVAARHSLHIKLEKAGTQERNKDHSYHVSHVTKGPIRDRFSDFYAEREVSTSQDSDFMAEFMQSEEEPSRRKRSKHGNEGGREEHYSGASSALMRDNASNEPPAMSKSPSSSTPILSFSALHFLSAVRVSLVGSLQMRQEGVRRRAVPFHKVVRRVQANPGDVQVLSVQEPLDGLVRGALKVLSFKTALPLIQGWKPLVIYDKPARGWCWVGGSSDMNSEETDADAWGISQKALIKIVNAFVSWFDDAQETLQLFAELGAPPLPQRPFVLNEEERFQGLRAQRSLITINPTSNEMRAYFQQEEAIRYSLQDTVFFYTTACGEKSAVAPLKRLGGKPNSKARDHFVLRSDRPSHVTILYLVRDAAARLPRSLGTRADVAVLLRDSRYIVDDASDTQLSQVVSGALDRLRYERDPCVQFDADRKLWVYLHADREEEDFEDDGTFSTKNWKRGGKKDGLDSFDTSGQDHAGTGMEPHDRIISSEPGYNSSPGSFAGSGDGDLNYTADTPELFYNHHSSSLASSFPAQIRDDGVLPLIDLPHSIQSSSCTNMQSHPMGWEMYR